MYHTCQKTYCTDTDQHEEAEKAEVQSVPGSPTSSEGSRGRWHRTPDLIRGSTRRAATRSSDDTHCLCHLSRVHTCKEIYPHLRESTAQSVKSLVCWYKAQPRPGSCTWSPRAYKTYINPEFKSLAFCPYTCIPVIVPLHMADCNATSDGLCINLARNSASLSLLY